MTRRCPRPDNRAELFKVVTTILDASIDGGQIGDLYERRWDGEVDIRAIKSVMQMDVLRCKAPEMVHKEIWAHLLAYNLLRTVMAVAAAENGIEPRQVSFKGAKQAVTAFAPKIEAARREDRPALIDALLAVIAYHRVGDRPGRWEPRRRSGGRSRGPAWTSHEPRPSCRRIARNGSKASAIRVSDRRAPPFRILGQASIYTSAREGQRRVRVLSAGRNEPAPCRRRKLAGRRA